MNSSPWNCMPDTTSQSPKPNFLRHLFRALLWILLTFSIVLLSAFIALNYFGEHFIKSFLQAKIHQTSQGVYKIDFDRLHFNLFSGKTSITDFHLIPNEERYNQLREKGKVKGTLYSIVYQKLILNHLSLKEMFLDRAIHLRMIEIEKPVISFIAFPDSLVKKRGRFKHLYQDIYPLLSQVFKEVRIDSIRVSDGSFSGKGTLLSGKTISGDWLYSAILRDFDLNAYDYKEERVFYSKEVELRIRNFNYALADSLYILTADEVGFSLTGSRLFGKGLTLTPNFLASKRTGSKAGSFYQVYLPEFSITGVNLYKALLDKQLWIHSITIDHLDARMFQNKPAEAVKKKKQPKVTIANLYTIIQDKLKNITIDTFLLSNASFRYYPTLTEPRPEVQINRATLELHGFHLDSVAHLDTSRILYSEDIELDFEGFTLALQDKLHDLSAQKVVISTRRSLIEIYNTKLYPSLVDPSMRYKSNSIYKMRFPQVKLEQINLLRMFNSRNLELRRVAIFEPDMMIVQYRNKQLAEDSLERKETVIQKLDLISHVVIPYMVSIDAGTIEISNARIRFIDDKQGLNEERIAGLVDFTLTGFMMDTVTHYDRKEFLNRLEVNLSLRDFRYLSPDSLHHVRVKELYLNSFSQVLDINEFNLFTTSKVYPGMPYPSTFTAQFSTLQVHGFDHRKWIGEHWFSADDIRLLEPRILIQSVKKTRESSLNEPFSDVDDVVSKIDVGTIRIDKGWFDITEEDRKSRGSLLIRNFDFQLSNFLFDLTGWDKGIKILRYDLLSLKPDTTLPILFDSTYLINFKRLLSDSYPPNLAITNLHIAPMSPTTGKKPKTLTVELSLPSFVLNHLDLENVLFNRDLRIGEVLIRHPEITLDHLPHNQEKKSLEKKNLSTHPELKTPFTSMEIGKVILTDGIFHYHNGQTDSSTRMDLKNIDAIISGFSYDSTSARKSTPALFFCEDFELHTGGYSLITKDSMNTISIARLHLSTGKSTITIDSFALVPNFSDDDYSRKLGYQTDRMELRIPQINVKRFDFQAFLEENTVFAGEIGVTGLTLNDYRDKRVEFPTWKRPPMIQQAIRKITIPVTVDTVLVTGGKVIYREQTGDEPGMIFFDRMNGLVRNFTSDSLRISRGAELIADGTLYFMGEAEMSGEFRFPLQSPVDTFFFRGKAGRVDMSSVNPMVAKVTPVKINSGIVDSLDVHWMRGNGIYATGLLDLYYHDLQIELLKEKKGFLRRTGTDLLQFIVNMAVPEESPGYFGIHRSGYIWNNRNDEKGYFNFFWKSLLSGLKSSEGINSKEQRAFKKSLQKQDKRN
ncbi:MAG: DUF748 domain-containing protein [Bacteroidales bacterium]|nr:DUF748 domain-containing protein [Bacteroidales bacterium]